MKLPNNHLSVIVSSECQHRFVLCPTCWTVRAEALASIAKNYEALQLTWDTVRYAMRDTEMRACI